MMDLMSARSSSGRGELEFAVLECLWNDGPLTTRDVHDRIGLPRSLAYTTILTVLQRLYKKGLVGREEVGSSHLYAAIASREEFSSARAVVLAESLARLGESGVPAFVSHAEKIDPRMVEMLRRLLGTR